MGGLALGLDDIVLSAVAKPWARRLRWLTLWRPHRTSGEVRLRLALEHLGPIFVKFGQLLSTRRDLLPAVYANELAKLQDKVPPEDPQDIKAALSAAYHHPPEEIFSEFDTQPVGSASVAQVHRARLATGGDEVAVKVLRPNVKRRIARDLKLMESAAALMQILLKDGERLRPKAVVGEFAKHLDEEVNLLWEASNCAQIGRNFAASTDIVVPTVHWEWCRHEVMVMQFLSGIPISQTDALAKAGHDLEALAKKGINIFFTQVFRDSFFHADMHPGNLHVDDNGRFVLFDYGIVGRLSDFDKEYLARNFIAFFNRDYRRVAQMHVEAGWTPPDTDVADFEAEIRAVCEPIFAKPLKDISFGRLLLQMFQAARRFKLEVQPQLLLLQKTLLNVEGIGRDLSPDINLWDTAKPFLEKWASRQYGVRNTLKLLRRQMPDWLAVAHDLPPVARALLREFKNRQESENALRALRQSRRRWRTAAAVFAAAVLLLWGR